jgi:dTDP-N-acetylfucosamine:lipid II N-acetylfucosaminyltransferase
LKKQKLWKSAGQKVSKLKIVHLVRDDKFIDFAFETFEEVYPGQNKYILLSFTKKLKYLKKTPVEIINPIKFIFQNMFIDEDQVTLIHWLDYKKIMWLFFLKNPKKISWIGWGADYYNLFNTADSLMLPLTKDAFLKNKQTSLKTSFKYSLVYSAKSFFITVFKLISMKKIRYFAPVLWRDYLLVKQSSPFDCPEYLDWNYGNLEDHIIAGVDPQIKIQENGNILLGNSSAVENNHLDAFEALSRIQLGDKKVICPLSYGDTTFKPIIKTVGHVKLKSNLMSLDTFMPLSEYNKLISSCSVVIMNHLRQQGLGNILTLMYSGSKVYLQPSNPIYLTLKIDLGAHINSMTELTPENKNVFKPLVEKEVMENRRILNNFIGKDVMKKKTKKLIETLAKS